MSLGRNNKRNLHKTKLRRGAKVQKEFVEKIINTIQEKSRNELLYVMIIGGQSYYLSQDESDIDILAITLPKLVEVTFSKNTSNSHAFYEIDGKTVDVKYTDLRTFLSQLSKGNSSSILEVANLNTDREFLLFEKDSRLTDSILNILNRNMSKEFWCQMLKSIRGQILSMERNSDKVVTPKKIAFVKMLLEFLNNYLEKGVLSNSFKEEVLSDILKIKYQTEETDVIPLLKRVKGDLDILTNKFESHSPIKYSEVKFRNIEEEFSLLLVNYILNTEMD